MEKILEPFFVWTRFYPKILKDLDYFLNKFITSVKTWSCVVIKNIFLERHETMDGRKPECWPYELILLPKEYLHGDLPSLRASVHLAPIVCVPDPEVLASQETFPDQRPHARLNRFARDSDDPPDLDSSRGRFIIRFSASQLRKSWESKFDFSSLKSLVDVNASPNKSDPLRESHLPLVPLEGQASLPQIGFPPKPKILCQTQKILSISAAQTLQTWKEYHSKQLYTMVQFHASAKLCARQIPDVLFDSWLVDRTLRLAWIFFFGPIFLVHAWGMHAFAWSLLGARLQERISDHQWVVFLYCQSHGLVYSLFMARVTQLHMVEGEWLVLLDV